MSDFNVLQFFADNAGLNIFTALEKAYEQGRCPHWIPCDDRLPEEEGDYLVTVDPDYVPQGYRSTDVITWHNGKWIMADYFVLDGENRKKPEYKVIDFAMPVIAWMPLPEAWRG